MAKKNEVKKAPVNEIDEAVIASKNFVEKYEKQIVGIGCAIVLVVICVLCAYQYYIIPRNEKAAEDIAYAEQLFRTGEYEKALNGDAENAGFLQIAEEYGSTKSGNLANLYIGLCFAQQGKAEEAIPYLEKYNSCGDEMVSPAAIAALGNCYAEMGDNAKAVKTLVKAAEKADNNTVSPLCYIQAAQIAAAEGDKEAAQEYLQIVKDKYRRSPLSVEVDKYMEALK